MPCKTAPCGPLATGGCAAGAAILAAARADASAEIAEQRCDCRRRETACVAVVRMIRADADLGAATDRVARGRRQLEAQPMDRGRLLVVRALEVLVRDRHDARRARAFHRA